MSTMTKPQLFYTNGSVEAGVFGPAEQQNRTADQRPFLAGQLQTDETNIALLRQVHGTDTIRLHELDLPLSEPVFQQADGMFCETPGIVMVIRTADCLPLFFETSSESYAIAGILHCGWRSIAAGIIPEAFDHVFHCVDRAVKAGKLQSPELNVFYGPHIPKDSYETGREVAVKFPLAQWHSGGQKAQLSLSENVRFILENYTRSEDISLTDPFGIDDGFDYDRYYSHRRGDKERNLNYIRINK